MLNRSPFVCKSPLVGGTAGLRPGESRGLERSFANEIEIPDLAVIAGRQENIDFDPAALRLDIAADRAGVQARRIVERIAREE